MIMIISYLFLLQTSVHPIQLSFESIGIQVLVSSFLGFGSALLVNYILQKNQRKKQRRLLLNVLKQELSNLQEEAQQLDDSKAYVRPYRLPVWTGSVKSGHIQCLGDMPSFTLLLEVFSSIEEANMIEMSCFELVNSSSLKSSDSIIAIVQKNREKVKKEILKGLSIIERQEK